MGLHGKYKNILIFLRVYVSTNEKRKIVLFEEFGTAIFAKATKTNKQTKNQRWDRKYSGSAVLIQLSHLQKK